MITADFSWISFVLLIIVAIIGATKSSRAAKKPLPPVTLPGYDPFAKEVEIKEEDSYIDEPTDYHQEEGALSSSYDHEKIVISHQFLEEEEEEEKEDSLFDIRQAIISSEILKRPEY